MIHRLRHRADILKAEDHHDGGGGIVRSWMPYEKLWTEIIQSGSINDESDPSRDHLETHKILFRKSYNLKILNRIKLKDKIYRIKSLVENPRRADFVNADIEEVEDGGS